ncbi:MAG: glycosyltransferase [Flavobacterium sp.]
MKIALIGEYSRLHNSLKEGLSALGYEVQLFANRDAFKNYPSDVSFEASLTTNHFFFKNLNRVFRRILKINLQETERGIRFYFLLPQLKHFDVVQCINSNAIGTHPSWSRFFLKRIGRHNRKLALLHCGDDTPVIEVYQQGSMKYSILTPLSEQKKPESYFSYSLKYLTPAFRKLYEAFLKNNALLISCDWDYKIPLDQKKLKNTFIPNPVNIDKISFESHTFEKVYIFLGINTLNSFKKGVDIFEQALKRIESKYPNQITIVMTTNLPYQEYLKAYAPAHILLDQIYAYDQGYNALEAMARGKVVFTGAEQEFLDHYGLQADEVCINALPDVDYLVEKLSMLIENPAKIKEIGRNARAFIEREHHYIKIAERYLDTWLKT